MSGRRPGKKPSRTRRHRESVAAKRKARAFYKMRNAGWNGGVLDGEEAEGLASWRGCGVVLAAVAASAVVGWIAVQLFS